MSDISWGAIGSQQLIGYSEEVIDVLYEPQEPDYAPDAPDAHLEMDYEDRTYGDFDDDSYLAQYDDDPSPYSGTYSEE